jgi:glycosyltransferase involved in cell wall biosynthesis
VTCSTTTLSSWLNAVPIATPVPLTSLRRSAVRSVELQIVTPRVSVLIVAHEPNGLFFAQAVDSVCSQTATDWELLIVDDCSSTELTLSPIAVVDDRIRVIRTDVHEGPVNGARVGVAELTGELVAFLGPHDWLDPEALDLMSNVFIDESIDVAYSDHESIGSDGLSIPWRKPEFSPELLRAQNYVADLLVVRRSHVRQLGECRSGYVGPDNHDAVLRLTEAASGVMHVPRVLYHSRSERPDAPDLNAITSHCERVGIGGTVTAAAASGCATVRRTMRVNPLISVIVPTRGTRGIVWERERTFVVDAVRSIVESSAYSPIEFVVVYDEETPTSVLESLEQIVGPDLKLVAYDAPFNFSEKINLGAGAASGDLLLLLNDDTELIEPRSLEVMVGLLNDESVAMVGVKLLYEDGSLQHGGHIYNRAVSHACLGWAGDSPGPPPMHPLAVERECSGVTAAAALVDRGVFEQVGGFSTDFPLNYNDVDFSLKIRAADHRIIWTPMASWFHFESRTRENVVLAAELKLLDERWHHEIRNDPYYSPNLAIDRHDWSMADSSAETPRAGLIRRIGRRVRRAVRGDVRS